MLQVIKTYFNKDNTLICDSDLNMGWSAINELFYGDTYSRYIFHFNLDYIQSKICDKTFANISKLKHVINLYNCGGIDQRQLTQKYKGKQRAISFDLILFQIPEFWDEGRGYDYSSDAWIDGNQYLSNQGSNWFNSQTGVQWGSNKLGNYNHNDDNPYSSVCSGIYDNRYLQQEYQKYLNKEKSIIITTQHFDKGSENIQMDISDIVNKMLCRPDVYSNHGFCIAFSPFLEDMQVKPLQYVGFFTNNTSTWFEPYLETTYCEVIQDDRANFYLDKPNRLYFYSNIGGNPTNLIQLPTCTISGNYENGDEFSFSSEVKQATTGVYYTELLIQSYYGEDKEIESNRMLYDTWSDLQYFNPHTKNGIKLKSVTNDFVTKSADDFYLFNSEDILPKKYDVSISGVKYDEKIERGNGEVRKIIVFYNIPYTTNQRELIDSSQYRLFTKSGDKEITVIDWQPINKTTTYNYFLLDIDSLLPQKYYIEVKTESNLEIKVHKTISFYIANKISEVYS